MARVRGRDAVEQRVQRKLHVRLRVRNGDDVRAGHFGVKAVHRVGGSQHQHLLIVIDVSVDEDLDGFVGSVGEDEVVGLYSEIARDRFLGGTVLGIDREIGGRYLAG